MTELYFVRHAQPDYTYGTDATFPLSDEGMIDRMKAYKALRDIHFDDAFSSPYKRSYDTIAPIADRQGLSIITDRRLREREKGESGNSGIEMFKKRWSDFDFHEQGGESLGSVQKRNISCIKEILLDYRDKTVLIGTHGTALSTILNYYDSSFGFEGFYRIINYMPYVIRLNFNGETILGVAELCFVEKEYHGKNRIKD